jgi:hypothetical protein
LLSGEPVGGLLRIGGEPKRGDQGRQRFLAGLVPDAERIDMTSLDPYEIGDAAQLVEPAHCTASR